MILILDNAESILDPQGTSAREIYHVVVELSHFSNICLCITSRISTIPPDCETLDVPTLSIEAARDSFYRIYKNTEQPDLVDRILRQLDFHPLSVNLLATVAHHNKWNNERLAKEWDTHHTRVLRTDYNESLAATIELSLASPMFRELGPDARDLLGVVAFFPQGINENNLDWLLPTISNGPNTFDKFCALSLTYRTNGFVTMLAPLRDYLRPKDPKSSPLLCMTKDRYFNRLSVQVDPGVAGFEEARWIISEDVNVEHLIDIFTTLDTNSDEVWASCAHFIEHLLWYKRRLVVLGPKIEGLSDDHPSKPRCLSELSRLLRLIGNIAESKRLLIHALKLWRERENDLQVAHTLRHISGANRELGLYKEGILQLKEAQGIYKQFGKLSSQVSSFQELGWLFRSDNQPDAAEEAALRAIDLSGKADQYQVCDCYRLLSGICYSRGETKKAISHLETALGIASSFNWSDQLNMIHFSRASLLFKEGRFDDAHAAIECAKPHAINHPYYSGRTMELQAQVWYQQGRLEEAKTGALRAADIFEGNGAAKDLERCRTLLRYIEEKME